MKNEISINCHSSIKITGERTIYFDPYKIETKVCDADYIFITHDHFDHLDIQSLKNVMNEDTIVMIPASVPLIALEPVVREDQVIALYPNEQYYIDDMSVLTIPSYNINKDFHKKMYNWLGYVIELNQEKIYVAGDTDINEDVKKVECDVALVPIGGTYTMTYQEAAELVNTIKPKHVIPTHYGTIIGELSDGEEFKKLLSPEIECHLLIK